MKLYSRFYLLLVLLFSVACSAPQGGGSGGSASSDYLPDYKTSSKEFVFNNGAEPETLDPHRMSAHDAAQHANQLFEGLLSRGPDYNSLVPGLASEWSVSKDGLTYSFKLRPGIKWSNGEAITPEHVRGSMIRALNPIIANPYLNWYTDYVVGAQALTDGYNTPQKAALEKAFGVKVTGKDTLTITIMKPVSFFKYFLSQPPYQVVHPSMYDADSNAWKDPKTFITNSAYKLDEWTVNKKIVLVKNPQYYEADKVFFEKIVAFPIVEENTTYNLYNSGQLDWTSENTISSSLVRSLKDRSDFHISPVWGTYMYIFNVNRKPFDNKLVRQALSLAVDRTQITDRVIRSGIVPTNKVIPPVLKAYESLIEPMAESKEERIAKAKALLAEAGYKNPSDLPTITIRYNTNEGHHKLAQAIQQMWKNQLGINVELENMEWKVYLKEQNAKNFDICRQGWIGDFPDPTTFLEIYSSTSENNHTNWANKEYDDLITKAMAIQDDQERFAMLAKAEKILYEEAPMFAIYHYAYYSLMNPAIEGWEPNSVGHYHWKYLSKKDTPKGTN